MTARVQTPDILDIGNLCFMLTLLFHFFSIFDGSPCRLHDTTHQTHFTTHFINQKLIRIFCHDGISEAINILLFSATPRRRQTK
jgi:hypothetical protein